MAIKFEEIKKYLARNVRLSICFEDAHYQNYLIVSDIPNKKYDNLYVYGIGLVDVEFPMDVYTGPHNQDVFMMSSQDDTLEPAIEIVLHDKPREFERGVHEYLIFRDLKPYLQIGTSFSIVNREDWSHESYEYRRNIPGKYDDMYVYGITMENNPSMEKCLDKLDYNSCLRKRMVIVLSYSPRLCGMK